METAVKKGEKNKYMKDNTEKIPYHPYDDAWVTMMVKTPRLFIPLINEVFNEDIPENEEIIPLLREQRMDMIGLEKNESRVADTVFQVPCRQNRRFHFECNTRWESKMGKRLSDYSYNHGSTYCYSYIGNGESEIITPDTGVVILERKLIKADECRVFIGTKEKGRYVSFPVAKSAQFTLDELFDKHLFVLLPFHIFRYEKEIEKEALNFCENVYRMMMTRLEQCRREGLMTAWEHGTLVKEIRDVCKARLRKHLIIYEAIEEEFKMGGRVKLDEYDLKLIADIKKGVAEGLEKARKEDREKLAEEREKITKEREAEKERLAREREAEKERLAREREAEKERLAREREAEKEKLTREREAEKEKLVKEREKFTKEMEAKEEKLAKERDRMHKERESYRVKVKADQANAILDNMLRNPKMKEFSDMELSGIIGTTAEYVAARRAMITPE